MSFEEERDLFKEFADKVEGKFILIVGKYFNNLRNFKDGSDYGIFKYDFKDYQVIKASQLLSRNKGVFQEIGPAMFLKADREVLCLESIDIHLNYSNLNEYPCKLQCVRFPFEPEFLMYIFDTEDERELFYEINYNF